MNNYTFPFQSQYINGGFNITTALRMIPQPLKEEIIKLVTKMITQTASNVANDVSNNINDAINAKIVTGAGFDISQFNIIKKFENTMFKEVKNLISNKYKIDDETIIDKIMGEIQLRGKTMFSFNPCIYYTYLVLVEKGRDDVVAEISNKFNIKIKGGCFTDSLLFYILMTSFGIVLLIILLYFAISTSSSASGNAST